MAARNTTADTTLISADTIELTADFDPSVLASQATRPVECYTGKITGWQAKPIKAKFLATVRFTLQPYLDRGILFHPGGGLYGAGIDTSEVAFQAASIRLGGSQSIVIDGASQHGIAYAGGEFMFWGTGEKVFGVNHLGRFLFGYSVEFAPAVPARSSDLCELGQHAWDAGFNYRCIAPNRWRRAALSDC